jgi:hypothetical protein
MDVNAPHLPAVELRAAEALSVSRPARPVPVSLAALLAGAREQLEAKIAWREKRSGKPVTMLLYKANPDGRVLCRLTAGDGPSAVLYLHGTPNRHGDWWHRGY